MALKIARTKMVKQYCGMFLQATDLDRWGREEEAVETYRGLKDALIREVEKPAVFFNENQQNLIRNIVTCLDMRMLLLQSVEYGIGLSLVELMRIKPVLRDFMSWKAPFPLLLQDSRLSNNNAQKFIDNENYVRRNSYERVDDCNKNPGGTQRSIHSEGCLLPQLPSIPRHHRLTIRIMKIGVKDAQTMIAPTIIVHLKDDVAVSLTPAQETPVARVADPFCLHFGVDVEIQRHLENIPKGSAIFFELKYSKPKQKKRSTRCYSFMEKHEFKAGSICTELYQKPTDFTREKIRLYTEKPLYLHLELTISD